MRLLLGSAGLLSPALTAAPPLLLLLLAPFVAAQTPDFVEYPGNVTAPLGSNVTLECVANELAVGWKINGLQLLDEARIQEFKDAGLILGVGGPETVNGGNRITITIPATVNTSDTISTIVCQAGPTKFGLKDGETITFTVYGLPLSPGEVEVEGEGEGQLRVVWTPPFSLPGELISYSLLVRDETSGDHTTVGPLSDTSYTHTLSETQTLDCHLYSFSVFSINDVGLSPNSSSSTPALHPSGPGPFGTVAVQVSHDNQQTSGSRAVLRLSFEKPRSCFPLNYTLTLSEDGQSNVTVEPTLFTGSGEREMVAEATGLKENTVYSASLSAHNKFQFSIQNPVTVQAAFVTSGLQSVAVFHYENGTVRITCVFATGSLSTGCMVSLVLDSTVTTTVNIPRAEGAVEVVHYTPIGGVPQSATAQDLGVDNPLAIRGDVSSEGGPTPSTSPDTADPSLPSATPTSDATTEPSPSTTDLTGLLQWVIPAGVAVSVLALCVLFVGFCVCCRQSSKHRMRRSTLPRGLHVPHSPASPAYSHDYKQVPPPHVSGTIKEMSFNPLYGDAGAPTFDPPLPLIPHGAANGGDSITLPSHDRPPLYEEVSASRRAAKLAANPQYGAVGGSNGATVNPQYGAPPSQQLTKSGNEEHMYASLKDPAALSPTQKQSLQYALPYEHVASSHTPSEGVPAPYALPSPVAKMHAPPPQEGGVVILTDDNVSYNASPPLSSLDKSP